MNSFTPFEWIAAIRFLKEGRMQTIFIVSGIALGVAVIVFMSALMSSLQTSIIAQILTSQPHIQISAADESARPLRPSSADVMIAPVLQQPSQRMRSVDQWQATLKELAQRSDVKFSAASIATSGQAVRGEASHSISITGVDPDTYFNIIKLPAYITLGGPTLTSKDIMIGTDLATTLGATLGDRINVTGPSKDLRVLTISAIFDFGNRGVNKQATYVALRTAQTLSNLPGGVTSIDVTVNDAYAAEAIAREIQTSTGKKAESWIATNAQFFSIINLQNLSFGLIEGFVGLSVAFGIASVLVVSVTQRSKDIGILRAMGTTQGQILRIFLVQGGVLGVMGAVVGSSVGGTGFLIFHSLVRQTSGKEVFPLVLHTTLLVGAILLAAVTGVVAAAVPALRAARLDPVVAMNG